MNLKDSKEEIELDFIPKVLRSIEIQKECINNKLINNFSLIIEAQIQTWYKDILTVIKKNTSLSYILLIDMISYIRSDMIKSVLSEILESSLCNS